MQTRLDHPAVSSLRSSETVFQLTRVAPNTSARQAGGEHRIVYLWVCRAGRPRECECAEECAGQLVNLWMHQGREGDNYGPRAALYLLHTSCRPCPCQPCRGELGPGRRLSSWAILCLGHSGRADPCISPQGPGSQPSCMHCQQPPSATPLPGPAPPATYLAAPAAPSQVSHPGPGTAGEDVRTTSATGSSWGPSFPMLL